MTLEYMSSLPGLACPAHRCIRISRDFKDRSTFAIERTCLYKDSTCPHKKNKNKDGRN